MKKILLTALILVASFAVLSPLPVNELDPEVETGPIWTAEEEWSGLASYYGPGYNGRRTANGEIFNQDALTTAHRTLPFGTVLHLTNPKNGKSVFVVVNDRGPYCNVTGRVDERYDCRHKRDPREIDVSLGVARVLDFERAGVTRLEIATVRMNDE